LTGLATAFLLAAGPLATGLPAAAVERLEMTAVDITGRPEIRSSDCSVFGLRLGMAKEEVLSRLKEKDLLWGYFNGYLLTDKKFSDIVYVFDRTEQEAVGSALMRMNFNDESRLDSLTLYPAMSRHLADASKRLVDQDILEPEVRRKLLGEPSRIESEELPIIDLKLDIFHYPAKGFQIRHKHSYSKRTDEVYFNLVPPRPP
jgi:hypothetical protein